MSERDELLSTIRGTRHIRALHLETTADIIGHVTSGVTDAILAAGYRRPRTITTVDELDALPDDSLVVASGQYLSDGGFTDCWIRPIPAYITGGEGKRPWEVLVYLDGGPHNITYAEHVKFPVTVLHEPEATL